MYITICEISHQSKFDALNRALKAGALGQPRGMRREVGGRLKKGNMEKGHRGSGAGTLGVPLGGTRRVGGLLGVAKTQLQNVVNAVKTTVWRIIREWERERLRERQCVCV